MLKRCFQGTAKNKRSRWLLLGLSLLLGLPVAFHFLLFTIDTQIDLGSVVSAFGPNILEHRELGMKTLFVLDSTTLTIISSGKTPLVDGMSSVEQLDGGQFFRQQDEYGNEAFWSLDDKYQFNSVGRLPPCGPEGTARFELKVGLIGLHIARCEKSIAHAFLSPSFYSSTLKNYLVFNKGRSAALILETDQWGKGRRRGNHLFYIPNIEDPRFSLQEEAGEAYNVHGDPDSNVLFVEGLRPENGKVDGYITKLEFPGPKVHWRLQINRSSFSKGIEDVLGYEPRSSSLLIRNRERGLVRVINTNDMSTRAEIAVPDFSPRLDFIEPNSLEPRAILYFFHRKKPGATSNLPSKALVVDLSTGEITGELPIMRHLLSAPCAFDGILFYVTGTAQFGVNKIVKFDFKSNRILAEAELRVDTDVQGMPEMVQKMFIGKDGKLMLLTGPNVGLVF